VRGSGTEASSAAISSLGFGLYLMVHKVLMRMRGGARRRAVVLAGRWPEPGTGWKCAQERSGRKATGCYDGESDATGGRRGRMGSTPTRAALFIGGSTGSVRCGSFRRTTCFNDSIPINSREDCTGFVINILSHDLNSGFRTSAINKISSCHPNDKQVQQAPTSH
jgi:hypothetical protein